jgi:IPT/TIG domain
VTDDASSKYTAPPAPLPGFASLTVKATSVANRRASATNTITVTNPVPSLTSLAPSALPPGGFSLTVNGSGFVSGAQVLWKGAPLPTTFVSPSRLTATGTATELGPASVTVDNPGPGAVSTAHGTLSPRGRGA